MAGKPIFVPLKRHLVSAEKRSYLNGLRITEGPREIRSSLSWMVCSLLSNLLCVYQLVYYRDNFITCTVWTIGAICRRMRGIIENKTSIRKRQKLLHKCGRNSQIYRFWRNKVQRDVKVARKKYDANSVQKLKRMNPSRWWKEVKSLDGLSCQKSWAHQLLSEINPTCEDLAES